MEFPTLQAIHGKNEIPDKKQTFVPDLFRAFNRTYAFDDLGGGHNRGGHWQLLDMAILLFILFGNASISFIETLHALEAIAKLRNLSRKMKHASIVTENG